MRPDEPFDIAVCSAVGEHVKKLEKRLRKAAKKSDPDAVHDGRTALRRVRQDLVVMRDSIFDPGRVSPVENDLHALERSLAKARDTDVLLVTLNTYLKKHRRETRGLTELRERLETRRKRGIREARKCLRGSRRVVRDAEKLVRGKRAIVAKRPRDATVAVPRLVHHFTREALWKQYDAVLAYETCRPPGVESLHRFRAACRRLRYSLELFADALPDASKLVDELTEVQSYVGDMHDAYVAVTLGERWMEKRKLRATPQLARFIANRKHVVKEARGEILRRFEAVLGLRFRRSLARALEHEAA